MAVYTDIADEDLQRFVAAYDIGRILSYKGIAEGVENSNFLLKTDSGAYILTLYEKRVNPQHLPFFIGLMDHLAHAGVSCPLPIRNRAGEALGELSGRPAAIVSFLDGVWARRPTAQNCSALGVALARLHAAGQGFALQRENSLGVAAWRPLFDRSRDRADEVNGGLCAFLEAELVHLERNWPSDLPMGVIHADLFPDNVFFIGEDLSGLIDFYFACNDMLVYDLAICLNAWCFELDGSYNLTKGRALLTSYQTERRLTSAEVEAFPLLCRGAAVRFLLTRLFDWLNVPPGALVKPKDPMEYYRKLRFHRQVGAFSDYEGA